MSTNDMPFLAQYHECPWLCPCCGNDDETAELVSGDYDNQGGVIYQHMSCPKCSAGWLDTYTLSATARVKP